MTRWQHFLHAFGHHDWHKVKAYEFTVPRTPCGKHDPRPATMKQPMVDAICCQCGEKWTGTWREFVGI